MNDPGQHCVIIGASHAGVNCAFALRKEGWTGKILLLDADPNLPYHRPPLSKAFLMGKAGIENYLLKPAESYEKESIDLNLGVKVNSIDRTQKKIILSDGTIHSYNKLVIATGARALLPPIPGMEAVKNLFTLRQAKDALKIQETIAQFERPRVVIIGAGYIGLEIAASLKNLNAHVTVLEREERVLARVTSPEMSTFFEKLHRDQGVTLLTGKTVVSLSQSDQETSIMCKDGSNYLADMIVVGVGIQVNQELAADASLDIENGICVNEQAQTNDPDIYAIGDCAFHYNPYYSRKVRLESVQNAVDQAKVAAAHIAGKEVLYKAVPWFWSDQYDVKLQMVGLPEGHNQLLIRQEPNEEKHKFSTWYFKDEKLLAVDAINNAKAYVIGTKFIKEEKVIDKSKLTDPNVDLRPGNILATS